MYKYLQTLLMILYVHSRFIIMILILFLTHFISFVFIILFFIILLIYGVLL
jgi:hypothetical protein